MKVALAQINPLVGDVRGNGRKIVEFSRDAHRRGADLVVFPELSVTGYPPCDLLENASFLDAVEQAIIWISEAIPQGIGVLVGAPVRNPSSVGKRLFNAALLLEDGSTVAEVHKSLLPTYDVYDEYRYFEPAAVRRCVDWRGARLGIHICEDMWNSDAAADPRMYGVDPLAELAEDGADLFVNLSATPFSIGQHVRRNAVIEAICSRFERPFLAANQVGANAELIFDGDSRVHLADGRIAQCAPSFEEALLVWKAGDPHASNHLKHDDTADIYRALVSGVREYYGKSDIFSGILIGLSGGIDSAVTAALAVHAVGAENVHAVMLPAEYTQAASIEDARAVAGNLDIELQELSIHRGVATILDLLGDDGDVNVVDENVQARLRAVVLMGLSNRSGMLVLATGNKSELAVGYTTLYGDMAGGLGVLSDVYKSQVYDLARYINHRSAREVIPERVLVKPPSAELRPGQTDQDSLPPYETLDAILRMYIEERLDLSAIIARSGFEHRLVQDVLRQVDASEFKRRQAPPGLRITRRAFGGGYRMPLVSGWRREYASVIS